MRVRITIEVDLLPTSREEINSWVRQQTALFGTGLVFLATEIVDPTEILIDRRPTKEDD